MSTTKQTGAQTEMVWVVGCGRWHTNKFGMPGCPELLVKANELTLMSREKAEQLGHDPCGCCALDD